MNDLWAAMEALLNISPVMWVVLVFMMFCTVLGVMGAVLAVTSVLTVSLRYFFAMSFIGSICCFFRFHHYDIRDPETETEPLSEKMLRVTGLRCVRCRNRLSLEDA